jgi:hypothetical protein
VAAQQELGLLPQRRRGPDSGDFVGSAFAWTSVKIAAEWKIAGLFVWRVSQTDRKG